MTDVFIRRQCEKRHRQGGNSHVTTEVDVGMMYLQSQGTSKIADHHQTLERGSEGFYSESQREKSPADTLIWDF